MNLIKNIIMLVGLIVVGLYGFKLYNQVNTGKPVDKGQVKAMCDQAVEKTEALKEELKKRMEVAKAELERKQAENTPDRQAEPVKPVNTARENTPAAVPAPAEDIAPAVSPKAGPVDMEDQKLTAEVLQEVATPEPIEPPPSKPVTPEEANTISRIYQEANEVLQ